MTGLLPRHVQLLRALIDAARARQETGTEFIFQQPNVVAVKDAGPIASALWSDLAELESLGLVRSNVRGVTSRWLSLTVKGYLFFEQRESRRKENYGQTVEVPGEKRSRLVNRMQRSPVGGMEPLRVVAVSPGDVQKERDLLATVIAELNRGIASDRGVVLQLWRWETDAHPGLHLDGPQGRIDEQMRIADSDLVIGMLWRRFGTAVADSRSGTEHELRNAWASWHEHRRPEVMLYFRRLSPRSTKTAIDSQVDAVRTFKESLSKESLSKGQL